MPNLPGCDENGKPLQNVGNPPPLPGYDAAGHKIVSPNDGKPFPFGDQKPLSPEEHVKLEASLLPDPMGKCVAGIALSFIRQNQSNLWDVEVYFKAAFDFVQKVLAQNGEVKGYEILEDLIKS